MSRVEATQIEHALVDRLWVVDDRGVNHSWIARVKRLRDRIQSTITKTGPKRIMLTRGKMGAPRILANSDEVQAELEKGGFEIINPEDESVSKIVGAISSAEIVVVVEGSAQSHCTYALPPGSTLLTIQPPTRFVAISKDRADAVGYHWAFVVADPHPNGFYLPIDRLMRTLDEILRVTGRSG
jgi:capsular polysaccharide biosynthesis protein